MQAATKPVVEPEIRRWTVEEYYRLAEAGIIGPEERVELIDGEIIRMSPLNPPHAVSSSLAQSVLLAVFQVGWVVRTQLPLQLGAHTEPEPDFVVVRGRPQDFLSGHPTTAELIVEIADSSLRYDLGPKAELYARAGIPDYWVLNLPRRRLVVHRDPDPATGQYRTIQEFGDDATVAPLAAPDAAIAVRDLLP